MIQINVNVYLQTDHLNTKIELLFNVEHKISEFPAKLVLMFSFVI